MKQQIQQLEKQGYVVLEGLLSPADLQAHYAQIAKVLEDFPRGRNNFEGERTQRVYSLLKYHKLFADIAEHPAIVGLLDALLMKPYQLSSAQVIMIHEGETPQPLHSDGGFYHIPRPHTPMSYSTIWALDDFTTENGATEIVEGSHLWNDAQVQEASAAMTNRETFLNDNSTSANPKPVCMPAGSCLFFAGTLMHRGGANTTPTPRRAYTYQYCQPWVRPIENFYLSVSREEAAKMSPAVQSMLGYDVFPPFIGQNAGRHPVRVLRE